MLDIAAIRSDFPILQRTINNKPLVYLDNGATSQKPQQVIDAITNYYSHNNANIHRGVHTLSQIATDQYEEARTATQHFINAKEAAEIIFTKGTTESINLVAFCLGELVVQEGDEVLISAVEHHANIVPWQMLCERKKATLRVIPMNAIGELVLDDIDALITDTTKIISLSHVSNALGTILPIQEIIRKAKQKNIPVLVDGAQAAAHFEVDVQELDCDFYCFSTHKLLANTGVGVLYGKRKWLESMPPYQGGGDMIKNVSFEKTTYNEIPFKFEAGTPNIEGVIAWKSAIDYLHAFPKNALFHYEQELLAYATQKLQTIPGLKIYGQAANKVAVISFLLENIHPFDVGVLLDKMGIAVRTGHHCTQPIMDYYGIPGTIRASFCFYNTMEEIDYLYTCLLKAQKMLL